MYYVFIGSDGSREELPQTYGVLHATDSTYCVEHVDRERLLISSHWQLLPLVQPIAINILDTSNVFIGTTVISITDSSTFLNQSCTYVRTEVNYTEEVDDPVDSDGMWH